MRNSVADEVNRRTSSEPWARREAVQGSGGGRTVVRYRRRKSMGMGHWPLPYRLPSMLVSLVLASGCQSQNIIAAAGPDTFS